MASFVIFIDTPTWEVHYDPDHRSYHFEGRCAVRIFAYLGPPFAYPLSSFRFSPASPGGDDLVFEHARPRDEQRRRAHIATSAGRDYPKYVPGTRFSETDPEEDSATHVYSEGSAPTVPMDTGRGSEDTVTQPRVRLPEMRPRRGAHRQPLRLSTPAELR